MTSQSNSVGPRDVVRQTSLRVWLADLTYTQQAVSADLIPAAIGGIATFTETRVALAEPIRLFKYPERLAAALAADGAPDIIGFSNYIWNSRLASAFARRIKKLSPATVVVFGGPNYPHIAVEQETYLRQRPEIDFYVQKEGEVAFSDLVLALDEADLDREAIHGRVRSVHSVDKQGRVHLPEAAERLRDLTAIPSPYTTGRLDEFFDGKLLPIIQTNRGCPFGCTFCVEGVSYYNKIYRNNVEKVAAEIDYIGRKMVDTRRLGGRNDLFIADSNFGMYKDDIETCRAIARSQDLYSWPEYINVATGKNQKERVLEGARLIRGALRLSGSVQSLDPEVLKNVKRNNIAADQLMKLALDAADVGANSYSETILGLPGDSKRAHYSTLRQVIEAGFNMVSTFQLMLLPGSEMCTDESKKTYGMDLRYRVFPRCYGYFEVCGERVEAAEIEEVCVANNTLSFEDYLECRKMHLMIHIFHNDGVFATILKFLRDAKLSVFRWLELLRDARIDGPLAELFEDYLRATRDELWRDKNDLEAFVRAGGTIERYINGELGNNLLFTYKTLAITGHADNLAKLARQALDQLLAETGHQTDSGLSDFVDDALRYHVCSLTNLFRDNERSVTAEFRYDIKAYLGQSRPMPIAHFRSASPRTYRFVLDEAQRDLIARSLKVFGDTPWGVGRMLTKVYVRKLLRRAEPVDNLQAA